MAPPSHPTLTTPFSTRAEAPNTPSLARYLLSLISIKHSNLCVSADVHTTYELLHLAEEVGDHICILKTHADVIDDWSKDTVTGLQEVAKRKHFLLFEDRKLGDIGNTLQSQYTRGPLQIATWAHLTNAHLLPGPAIVPALAAAAQEHLTSLNQSVDTVITAGTPRLSLDGNDVSNSIPHATTTTNKVTSTNSQPPEPIPGASAAAPGTPRGEDQVLFSHSRNQSNVAYATTTISQHSEPLSPKQPPLLMKSVSQGEEDESEGHNPQKLLAALGPPPHARGLLLLAEMSSEGNLLTPEYTAACVAAAHANRDFVLGYITQHSLNTLPGDNFLCLAPGINLPAEGAEEDGVSGDGKGQRWRSPREVVGRDGIDVVIVGRGVLNAVDRGREADRYRKKAWEAYEERIGRR